MKKVYTFHKDIKSYHNKRQGILRSTHSIINLFADVDRTNIPMVDKKEVVRILLSTAALIKV